jgi:uncharacterized protein (DUF1800 family)
MSETTISRRDFLKGSAWAAALFGLPEWINGLDEQPSASYMAFGTTNYPLDWTPPAAPSNVDPAVVTLNRVAFGPRPGDFDRVRAMGVDNYVEEQLSPSSIDDSALDQVLQHLPSLTMTAEQLGQLYGQTLETLQLKRLQQRQGSITNPTTAILGFLSLFGAEPSSNGSAMTSSPQQTYQLLTEVIQATVLRQMFSARQLFEVLVDFWSNHFNIYILKNQDRYLKTVDDREVIRKYALGKFRDLLYASAHSPAMLVFLDNITNVQGVPNENYARELMELHTLSVNSGFTQTDVEQVARCFTGWSVSMPTRSLLGVDYAQAGEFQFRANQHDDGTKLVLGVKIPAGGGIHDGEQVLDLLARHPSTAQFIATKLVRRFVADAPPASLVQRATSTFTQSDGDIRAVLSTILHSAEFKQSFGQKAKRPLEYIASAVRALDAQLGTTNVGVTGLKGKGNANRNAAQNRNGSQVIATALRTMGQVPFMWQSPNGYPDSASAWINSNNLLARWNLALALTSGQAAGIHVDLNGAMSGADVSTPAAAVDFWTGRILHRSIPEADRATLISYLGGDTSPQQLANLVALILSSPHFQYR